MTNGYAGSARRLGLATIAAAGLLGGAGLAQAATLSFSPFNASAAGLDITVEISVTGSQAIFEFANASTGTSAGSSAARVYFESGFAALGITGGAVSGGTGTSFSASYPGPGSIPSGNTIDWAGEYAAFGALASPSHNGLEVGESLLLAFDYSGDEASLVNAILDPNGNARIAFHVLDCTGGNSCAAVSAAVIPVPAALPLFLGALAGLGFLRRRRG